MAAGPTLSVVLASAHPGRALDDLLEILLPQLAHVGGELVLIDGSPDGLRRPQHPNVEVKLVRVGPADDVLAMRARGAILARGWVVAFAEDHCTPVDDTWARAVVDAHIAHGHRAAVTGAVSNGTARTAWDRANFLMSFAPTLDPLPTGPLPPGAPPIANTSIKREVLTTYDLIPGFLELELVPHLSGVGHIATAPEVRMAHHQHRTAASTLAAHFHNGRTTTGLRRHGGTAAKLRTAVDSVLLVARHPAAVARELRRRAAGRRTTVRSLPLVVVLTAAHAAGQLVGLAAGPGRSPGALE